MIYTVFNINYQNLFIAKFLNRVKNSCIKCPHLLYPQFMSDLDKQERELALFMGLILLTKCQELWCFGSNISKGMAIELEKANHRKMVIRYFNDSCEEVINDA